VSGEPLADNPFERYRERVEQPLWRLFRAYGRPRLRWFSLGMVANLIARGSSLLPPLVLGAAIDALFSRPPGPYELPLIPSRWIPTGEVEQFWFSVALIAGAFVVTAVATWVYGVAANQFAHAVMHAVRTDSFETLQRLDMTFFDEKQTGEVMAVLNNDATNLERFLDNALQNSIRLGAMVIGIAAILFHLNAQLAVITLVAIPAMVVFTAWFMRAVEPRYAVQRASVGQLNTRLENAISGIELVKTAGTETHEAGRVTDASREYFDRTMDVLRLSYLYRPGMELLAGVAFVVTFLVGGFWLLFGPPLGFGGELSSGEFVVFLFLTQRFVTPLAEVSNIIDQYENAKASAERVFGLMDIPVGVADAPDAVTLEDPDGRVEFDGVSFAYDEEPVLRDIDIEAAPGETVGVVGPTGAGKSTLLKLLLRLYDIDSGAVRIDGHDVREVTLESLRDAVGYVSQDTFLFDGTVAENIRYGRFDADDAAVKDATRAAEAHAFIERLPEGYQTRVGERGVKLSGGQRQRVAIARLVLQDPAIVVLDEATSAVDTETELLIQRSLDRLAADRTTFAIAHRLSTIKDADTIIVLESGAVVERGTHDELLAADGLYANLWRVQAGELDSLPASFVEGAIERRSQLADAED
jgi:ATP-binding cassette subfamily B protein